MLLLDIEEIGKTFARCFSITMPGAEFADAAVFFSNYITPKQDTEDMPM